MLSAIRRATLSKATEIIADLASEQAPVLGAMAEVIWTIPAFHDLDAIADYNALDERPAARGLVQRVFPHVEQLEEHSESGSHPPDMRQSRYRQIVEAPCRVFYRFDNSRVFVL